MDPSSSGHTSRPNSNGPDPTTITSPTTALPPVSYCDHAGWGLKQGAIVKSWKRRYFVLKGALVLYFAGRSQSGKGLDEKGRVTVTAVEFTPHFHNALVLLGSLRNQRLIVQFESNDACQEWHHVLKRALRTERQRAPSEARASSGGVVVMQGWLYKEGQNFKTWKRRYMTLRGNTLQYRAAVNEAPLGEVQVQSVNTNNSRKHALDVYSDNNRILRIAASSFAEIDEWDQALAAALGRQPCFGNSLSEQPKPFLGDDALLDLDCDGWLYMPGFRSSTWKKRYFALKYTVLQCFDNPGESPRIEGSVVDLKLGCEPNHFEIKLDDGKWLPLAAESEDEADKWLYSLCEILDRDPSNLQRANKVATSVSFSTLRTSATSRTSTVSSIDDMNLASARKTGWLRKEGRQIKSWKRRYFVLCGSHLRYFENIGMKTMKGEGTVEHVHLSSKHANGLDISFTNGRVLRVTGESSAEIRSWMEALCGVERPQRDSSTSGLVDSILSADSDNQSAESLGGSTHGWLLKQGKNFKTWKERYFTVEGCTLTYYSQPREKALGTGFIDTVKVGYIRPFALEIKLRHGRGLVLAAISEEEFRRWCVALKGAIEYQRGSNQLDEYIDAFDNDDMDDEGFPVPQRSRPVLECLTSDVEEELDELEGLHIAELEEGLYITSQFDVETITCSGWLRKEGGKIKSWKLRYFTLYGTLLRYFKTDKGPLLGSAVVVHVTIVRNCKHSFELTFESGRKLSVVAEAQSECDHWLGALRGAIAAARGHRALRGHRRSVSQTPASIVVVPRAMNPQQLSFEV